MLFRIRPVSDLHLENDMSRLRDDGCDAIVVAGDLSDGIHGRALALLRAPRAPTVVVLGNHDHHGMDAAAAPAAWRRAIAGVAGPDRVRLLERETWDIGPVRFIGCTWWSGIDRIPARMFGGRRLDVDRVRRITEEGVPDFGRIRHGDRPFSVEDMLAMHAEATAFIAGAVPAAIAAGRIPIVVTHMPPVAASLAGTWKDDVLAPYFANDRPDLTAGVAVWFHGHVHTVHDAVVPSTGCRVVCNARPAMEHDPELVVTVPDRD